MASLTQCQVLALIYYWLYINLKLNKAFAIEKESKKVPKILNEMKYKKKGFFAYNDKLVGELGKFNNIIEECVQIEVSLRPTAKDLQKKIENLSI